LRNLQLILEDIFLCSSVYWVVAWNVRVACVSWLDDLQQL